MVWSVFFTAVGLLFVFEGILPFLSPGTWRNWVQQMLAMSEQSLRIMGLVSMLIGLLIVILVNHMS